MFYPPNRNWSLDVSPQNNKQIIAEFGEKRIHSEYIKVFLGRSRVPVTSPVDDNSGYKSIEK